MWKGNKSDRCLQATNAGEDGGCNFRRRHAWAMSTKTRHNLLLWYWRVWLTGQEKATGRKQRTPHAWAKKAKRRYGKRNLRQKHSSGPTPPFLRPSTSSSSSTSAFESSASTSTSAYSSFSRSLIWRGRWCVCMRICASVAKGVIACGFCVRLVHTSACVCVRVCVCVNGRVRVCSTVRGYVLDLLVTSLFLAP